MRVLERPIGMGARDWGRLHGESFRGEIRSLADIRTYLTCKIGNFASAEQVYDVARAHLPALERYDGDLHQELLGIAEGADVDPAHVIVLNHYTDLRDIDGSVWPDVIAAESRPDRVAASAKTWKVEPLPPGDGDGGCSIVWSEARDGPVAAQTWDMHATAIPYVLMMRVPEHTTADGARVCPESWLFSLTGCLGMAGMNRHGVALYINNLVSTDARVGLIWPALVRRALAEESARRAAEVIVRAPVGSGHHYLVADPTSAFGIETSGTHTAYIFARQAQEQAQAQGPASYVHTNHSLDPEIAKHSRVPVTSTTHDRMAWLEESIENEPVTGVRDLWNRLGSDDGYPRSVCTNMSTPENPHGTATCGAVAMELAPDGGVWAAPGLIHNVSPERFSFTGDS